MNSIIETLNLRGGQALNFAWPMLWQSSLLIGVLFALDFALRRKLRAAVRYALWLVVLLKLLLPPSLTLPTGIGWWLRPATVTPVKLQTTSFVVSEAPVIDPSLPAPEPPSFIPPPRTPLSTSAFALLVWCTAGIGLLAWLVVRWLQVARDVRRAGPVPESVNESLSEARRLAGVRHSVRLKLTDRAMSPAVCGLFRPVILLPRALAEQLGPAQLRAVLLHELTHLRRGDVWVNCAQALLQILYWWHPLLWLANARIRRVREEAVDDAVMLALREDAETYAPTLLEVAKLAFNRPLASLGLVGILESRSALRQRIERLVDFRAPRRAGLSVLSLLGIAAFVAVAAPMGEAPPPRAQLSETQHTDPTGVPDSNGITEPSLDGEMFPAATQASQTGQASTLSFQRELNKLIAQKTEWQRQIAIAKSQVTNANQRLNDYTTLGIQDNIEQWQKSLEEWRERLKVNEAGLDKVNSELYATAQAFPKANKENPGICPGDSIDVVVAGDEFVADYETFTGTYQVRQGGYIIMPRVGRIFLAGKTFTEAGQAIRDALAKSGSPNATVTFKHPQNRGDNTPVIFLCGEFIRPGAWPVPPGDKPTIVTAILRSGGIRPAGDVTRVQLLRLVNGQAQVEEVNVQAIMNGAGLPSDPALKPGDIVFVPAFANLVYVTGCVVKPGALKLLPDDELTAYSAILRVGGFDRFANRNKVFTLRDLGNGAKQKIPVSIKELQEGAGSDLILKNKDIVVVPKKLNLSPEGESKADSVAPPREQTNRVTVPRLSDLPLYGRFFRAEGETNNPLTPSPQEIKAGKQSSGPGADSARQKLALTANDVDPQSVRTFPWDTNTTVCIKPLGKSSEELQLMKNRPTEIVSAGRLVADSPGSAIMKQHGTNYALLLKFRTTAEATAAAAALRGQDTQRNSAEPKPPPRAHVEVSQGLPASATNAVLNLVLTAPSSLPNWPNKQSGPWGLMKTTTAASTDPEGRYKEQRLLAIRPEGFVMMFAEVDTGVAYTNVVLFRYGEITETNTPRWKIVGQFEW